MEEQLHLYLHKLLLEDKNKFDQKRLDQIKTIQKYAKRVINFIAQFEDELVAIWDKPKFALNANYVITIDKLSEDILKKLAKHQGLKTQIKEWQELGVVDENFKFKDVFEDGKIGEKLTDKYKHLPIDTKYFKDLEIEILDLFENLDEALDGRLIHSENYQALNTLLPKYKEKVQCIYIDPPFNLDKNADFAYKVNYKDSNWATMLENRIRLARSFLNDRGSIFVRCDYNGNYIVRMLLDDIFGKENFRNELSISRIKKSDSRANKYNSAVDTLFWYSKTQNYYFDIQSFKINKKARWHTMDSQGQGKAMWILGELREPPKGRHWTFSQEKIAELEKEGKIKLSKSGKPLYLIESSDTQLFDSNWTDIPGYSSTTGFQTENSEKLLQRVIQTASQDQDLVFDFFAGSATTQAVAQKLGRKWLGVEMGNQFFTVDIPRMKLVIFGKQSGISKDLKPKYKGGGFFKYYDLEQYEQTLRNMRYNKEQSLFTSGDEVFEQYIFFGDEKLAFEDVVNEKKGKININFNKLYENIDWPETLSNLLGKPIKKIKLGSVILQDGKEDLEIRHDFDKMNNNEKIKFLQLIKPLIWWGR